MSHALIVEDDVAAADTMAALIAADNFTVSCAHSLREAQHALTRQPPDIVLLDIHLPDGSGLSLLEGTDLANRAEVVLITARPSVETSVQALRLGVSDYLTKPINFERLQSLLARYMRPASLKQELDLLSADWEKTGQFALLWGRSEPMQKVYQQIARVAGSHVTVLVTGESGTGKELVARSVHELSRRRHHPFMAVNCGAISHSLIESELFGHEKGSFTGAERQRIGYFEQAHGGTLFLDEVTEMPAELQVKLLRVLETGMFTRVGSTEERTADVRIIAATNRDPEQAVAEGKLREDLLYRLNVFPIALPSLRSRGDDVVLLAEHILRQLGRREGETKRLSHAALRRLTAYRWPGNVRELTNAMQRAYLMTPDHVITDEWLPMPGAAPAVPAATADAVTIPIGSSLADAERALILATLQHLDHHKDRTASVLGVSRKTLYNRLQEYASQAATDAGSAPRGKTH